MRQTRLFLLACLFAAAAAYGGDWPNFLGPEQSGISPETGLLRKFPAEGPRVLWTKPVGRGYAGVAIRAGKVYLLDRVGKEDILRCLDLATGAELWNFAYEATGNVSYPGSRTVPAVDDEHVYTVGAYGNVHAISLKTHKPVWSAHLIKDFQDLRLPNSFQAHLPKWGITASPVLHGDRLIVAPHAVDAGLVAFDKRTGKLAWRSPDVGTNAFSHTSPHLMKLGGVEQVVMVANRDAAHQPPAILSGIDVADGRLLWQTETHKRYNVPIPQPLKISDDTIFLSGGYELGCLALKVTKKPQGGWQTAFLFKDNDNVNCYAQSPLFYKGHIYAQSYDKYHQQTHHGLTCVKPDGSVCWKTGPEKHFGGGNFIIADGMLIVLHDPKGELVLAEATPEAYRELARAKVLQAKGGEVWAPMALADGKLILRDLTEIKCVALK